ncbi:MAG: DUF1329 domain-containing protein [Candidatus Reddybacter sp.]
MNFNVLLAFSRTLSACAILGLLVFSVVAKSESANNSESIGVQTWRTLDQLTSWERERIDFHTNTPRDKKIPYLPAEPFPFTTPYTAEEMGFRAMTFTHTARWSHVMADAFGTITKEGYLTQGVTVAMVDQMDSPNAASQIAKKPGEAYSRHMYYYTYPPKSDGVQEMWVLRRTGLESPAKLDYFAYTPSLRRVRRQPPPRRETPFPGVAQSFDDILGLEAWEFDWRLIGADVLHETVRFPTNRKAITLAEPNGRFYDVATDSIKLMQERYPFYREDGGVNCFVVVGTPKKDWLPDFEVSKVVYWLDQYYFYPLRIERYDKEGKLKMIEVRIAQQENKALPNGEGFASNLVVYFDAELDLISYSLHDAHLMQEWTEEDLAAFTPDFMRRRWLKYPQQSQSMVNSPEEYYLRPSLFAERFPSERSMTVSPAIAARITAQNKAGHLVFGSVEKKN